MTELKALLQKGFLKSTIGALIFMTAMVYAATSPSASDAFINRRITSGTKLFRALLAADFDLAGKTINDGHLKLCLLYVNDDENAQRAADVLLHDKARIKNIYIRIEIVSFASFVANKTERIAGIFLTQPLSDDNLNLLIERVNEQSIIVFSPFEGDVERGVQSGLAVESRVRPYLNVKALQTAEIRLKSFFWRVSKRYEE